jgi:hypothetical protein
MQERTKELKRRGEGMAREGQERAEGEVREKMGGSQEDVRSEGSRKAVEATEKKRRPNE